MHQPSSTGLCCVPPACAVHHQPVLCTMVTWVLKGVNPERAKGLCMRGMQDLHKQMINAQAFSFNVVYKVYRLAPGEYQRLQTNQHMYDQTKLYHQTETDCICLDVVYKYEREDLIVNRFCLLSLLILVVILETRQGCRTISIIWILLSSPCIRWTIMEATEAHIFQKCF